MARQDGFESIFMQRGQAQSQNIDHVGYDGNAIGALAGGHAFCEPVDRPEMDHAHRIRV